MALGAAFGAGAGIGAGTGIGAGAGIGIGIRFDEVAGLLRLCLKHVYVLLNVEGRYLVSSFAIEASHFIESMPNPMPNPNPMPIGRTVLPAIRTGLQYHTAHAILSYMSKKLFSVRLDERLVEEARRSAGAHSPSEAIQRALELLREEGRERRFWRRWAGKGGAAAFRLLDRERLS